MRAICSNPRPTSNCNRTTSLILHAENFLAGKLSSLFDGRFHAIVLSRAATRLWTSIWRSRTPFRIVFNCFGFISELLFAFVPEPCFEIIPECRSELLRNRVHRASGFSNPVGIQCHSRPRMPTCYWQSEKQNECFLVHRPLRDTLATARGSATPLRSLWFEASYFVFSIVSLTGEISN